MKNVSANGHVQLITDFNLIYENPNNTKLYQIGTLFTKPTSTFFTLLQTENYNTENKTQRWGVFEEAILVENKLYFVKSSRVYLDKPSIIEALE